MQKAMLLHASLAAGGASTAWSDGLLQALPYARRLQLERADAAARTASLSGLALALAGAIRLAGTAPRVDEFRFSSGAKPRLAYGPGFSVSHTAGRVACVVCTAGEIGLDIERVRTDAGPLTLHELWRWTATEAVLKAAGLGLRQVQDVAVEQPALGATLHGRRYALREVRLSAQVIGHLASTDPVELRVEGVDLDGSEVSTAVQRALGLAA
jgi:phosphopantetheinyl transferase